MTTGVGAGGFSWNLEMEVRHQDVSPQHHDQHGQNDARTESAQTGETTIYTDTSRGGETHIYQNGGELR